MSQTRDPLPGSFAELAAPELSGHATRQWDDRMPAGAVAPETALADAESVPDTVRPLFQTGHHPVPDDIRLYAGRADGIVYGAVFVIMDLPDSVARTVYRVESEHDAPTRAYCWAFLQEDDRP